MLSSARALSRASSRRHARSLKSSQSARHTARRNALAIARLWQVIKRLQPMPIQAVIREVANRFRNLRATAGRSPRAREITTSGAQSFNWQSISTREPTGIETEEARDAAN
jgi:hypothetical protein